MRRAWALLGAGALAVGGAVACAAPEPDTTACEPADSSSVQAAQAGLNVEGTLRNGFVHTEGDHTFLSAELHLAKDRDEKPGDILTFLMGAGPTPLAVDEKARTRTTFPAAPLDVRAPGARESRGCVAPQRGKVPGEEQ